MSAAYRCKMSTSSCRRRYPKRHSRLRIFQRSLTLRRRRSKNASSSGPGWPIFSINHSSHSGSDSSGFGSVIPVLLLCLTESITKLTLKPGGAEFAPMPPYLSWLERSIVDQEVPKSRLTGAPHPLLRHECYIGCSAQERECGSVT